MFGAICHGEGKYSRVSSVEEYDSIVVSFAKGSHKLPGKHVEMLRELVRKAQAEEISQKLKLPPGQIRSILRLELYQKLADISR